MPEKNISVYHPFCNVQDVQFLLKLDPFIKSRKIISVNLFSSDMNDNASRIHWFTKSIKYKKWPKKKILFM
jgi:hypothetical protein